MPPRYSREIEQPIVMGDSLKDQFRTSPCEASCPAGNPIQKMQSLVEKGRFGEALRYLRHAVLALVVDFHTLVEGYLRSAGVDNVCFSVGMIDQPGILQFF